MAGALPEAVMSATVDEPQRADERRTWTTRSLLVADCGSAHTKVALISVVDGRYRLVARAQSATTNAPPVADLSVGVLRAVAELERVSGRVLLRDGRVITPQFEDDTGVDGFVLSTSVGGPLRLLTTGPGREALAALVQLAVGGLFVSTDALPVIPESVQGDSPEWQQVLPRSRRLTLTRCCSSARSSAPGAARRPSTTPSCRLGAGSAYSAPRRAPASPRRLPSTLPVLFTGNTADAEHVTTALQRQGASPQSVGALTPATLAPLSRAVNALYEGCVLRTLPGYADLRALATVPPTSCVTALSGMVRYLAQHFNTNVVGADVGANSTAVVGATAQGEYLPASHPMAGVGAGAGVVLRARGPQNILRWLSTPGTEDEVREYVLGRMLRPHALPASPRELELEHALAREAIALALRAPGSQFGSLSRLDVVVGTGSVLANVPHPGLAALILLDALQPRGITSLVLDTGNIADMLGGAAALDSGAAADVAENDAIMLQLGTFISPTGVVEEGEPMLRVVMEYADGRKHVDDVPAGVLRQYGLAPNEQAILGLYPAATVDVGLGPGQQARATEPVEGGALGLVIDTRGRPLTLPEDPAECARSVALWRKALGIEG